MADRGVYIYDTVLVDNSFIYSFYFIMFALIVSLAATIVSNKTNLRLILFIEILITGISAYMYYLFTNKIKTGQMIDLKSIDILRYNGWAFSTPLMMSVLCLVLSASTKIPLQSSTLVSILSLDYIMLFFGYIGELNWIDRISSTVLGFIAFFTMFYVVFTTFILKYDFFNYTVFFVYFILWAIYGVAYLLDETTKHVVTNFLDVTAKGAFAIGISTYYTFVL